MVTEPFSSGGSPPAPSGASPGRSSRGRRTVIVGSVVTVVSLIVGVVSVVIIVMSMGRPLSESLTNPSRPTPIDEKLTLRGGRYTVFELTGRSATRGPVTTDRNDAQPITVDDVQVTGPDGSRIPTSKPGAAETMTRGAAVYSGAVRFTTPGAGVYRVRVSTPEGAQVVIAPAFGSGFDAAWPWVVIGFASSLAFLLGVILLIVGAVRRRRQPVPQPAWSGIPPRGWYPAPDVDGKQRYWDGQAWTQYLR